MAHHYGAITKNIYLELKSNEYDTKYASSRLLIAKISLVVSCGFFLKHFK